MSEGAAKGEEFKGYVYLLIAVLLWSTAEVGIRYIRDDISPLQLAFARFFLGGILLAALLPFDLKRKRLRLERRIVLHSIWLSILGVVITGITFNYALKTTGASVVATMYGAAPIFVFVLSRIILGDIMTLPRFLGVVLGFVGIFVLGSSGASEYFTFVGFLLTLLNTLAFALFSVLLKKYGGRYAGLPFTALTVMWGSAFLFIPVLIEWDTSVFENLPRIWPMVLYLGVCTTGISYLCFFTGLDKVDATRATSIILLKPPIVAVIAAVWLDEPITLRVLLSMALILGGLYLVNLYHYFHKERVVREHSGG